MLPSGDLESLDGKHSTSSVVGSHLELALHSGASVESQSQESAVLVEGVDDRHHAEDSELRSEVRTFNRVETCQVYSS